MTPKWRRRLAVIGILLVVLSPAFFWKTCGDAGAGEPTGDGIELVAFTGYSVTYAIDDVRTCSAGMGPAFLAVGAATLGYLLLRPPSER